jgi:Fic family protein
LLSRNPMTADTVVSHAWQPVAKLANPSDLALPEMRALEQLWRTQRHRLEQHGEWRPFWERMVRWWSIETGVLERVFDISMGVTQILVEQGFAASLIPHGESDKPADQVIAILDDHKASIDMVMDVVGGTRSLTVGWIKELHALLCAHQDTARAVTPAGLWLDVPLPKGSWKTRPNSPHRPDGTIHEYCPPEQVASEMERMVDFYHAIPSGLPEVRSAWLHHAFSVIHPFEDGNGRVARALASLDFLRSGLFPVLILRDDKFSTYLPALEKADQGDLRPLVQLFYKREERMVLRAISEAEAVLESSSALSAVLAAAKSKVDDRSKTQVKEREKMRGRIAQLANAGKQRLDKAANEIKAQVPGCRAVIRKTSGETAHYFRAQIVETAKRGGYWADLHEPWEWVRLQITDGGITDIVVVLHFTGNPSPGACIATAFMGHRSKHEDEFGAELLPLDPETLLLYPTEADDAQSSRFSAWLETTLKQALAVWVRYL